MQTVTRLRRASVRSVVFSSWKCSYLLNHMVHFDQILLTYTFQYCLDTGMQYGEALPSISPAGRGNLLKMLVTLETHGIF